MKACPACNSRYDDNTTYCVRDGSAVVPDILAANEPMIGQLIGDRYKVIKKIGEGGMGEVYVAEHIHIEKRVALKLLRPEVLSNQEAVSRFRIEARSASSIGHDNIIQIDDFGALADGRIYMAMEFLQGAPLNDMLAKEPLPTPRALDILIQVTKGLSAAHAKGITHRDMKPENIYVTNKEGRDIPKILDFGIAKVSGGDTAQNLTVAGTIFGTPFYMAPEQAMGGKMDHRVDIYAMGIILYEVFCGTVPFKAETFMGILTQHITMQPVPPTQMAAQNGRVCMPEIEAIILKAIQKDAGARYQSMNELGAALIELYRMVAGSQAMTAAPWAGGYYGGTGSHASYGTSSNIAIKPPKKWVLPVVIGGVVLLGGGALAAVMWPKPPAPPPPAVTTTAQEPATTPTPTPAPKPTPPEPKPTPPPEPKPVATTMPTTPTTPEAPKPTPTPVQPQHPSGPKMVDVFVNSTPANALVYENGAQLGRAPVKIKVKAGEKTTLTFKLEGYKDGSLVVDGSKDIETGKLARIKKVTPSADSELKGLDDDDGLAKPKGM